MRTLDQAPGDRWRRRLAPQYEDMEQWERREAELREKLETRKAERATLSPDAAVTPDSDPQQLAHDRTLAQTLDEIIKSINSELAQASKKKAKAKNKIWRTWTSIDQISEQIETIDNKISDLEGERARLVEKLNQ